MTTFPGGFGVEGNSQRQGSLAGQNAEDVKILGGEIQGIRRLESSSSSIGEAVASSLSVGGVAVPESYFGVTDVPNPNILDNGDFRVCQDGATYALTTAVAYSGFDRWWAQMVTAANGVLNRASSRAPGFLYCAKLSRNAASTSTNKLQFGQACETAESVKGANRTMYLVFTAWAGANFSGPALVSTVDMGKGTDQSSTLQGASGWTSHAVSEQIHGLAITEQTFVHQVEVPRDVTQLGVRFSYIPSGTAGADDAAYITGVALIPATLEAPLFRPRHIADEIRRARYYYRRWDVPAGGIPIACGLCTGVGAWFASGLGDCTSDMRTVPAIALGAFGNYLVYTAAGAGAAVNGWTVAGNVSTNGIIYAIGTVAAGLVAGNATILASAAAAAAVITADSRL